MGPPFIPSSEPVSIFCHKGCNRGKFDQDTHFLQGVLLRGKVDGNLCGGGGAHHITSEAPGGSKAGIHQMVPFFGNQGKDIRFKFSVLN